MVATRAPFSFCWFRRFVANRQRKPLVGKPHRWANMSRNRAHGPAGQNKILLIHWAAKQEKFQPAVMYFPLTSGIDNSAAEREVTL